MLRCPGVGNCQVLKSRGWGIYCILAKKIQIPGVLPGGGMVTAGIDPCISNCTFCMFCLQVSLPREYTWPEANLKIVVLPDEQP